MLRRTFLVGTAAAALAGCDTGRSPAPPSATAGQGRAVTVETVRSAARGRDVRLVIVRPEHAVDRKLPVCVSLHGRGADAYMTSGLGLPDAVTDAATPFAMVGLDGGDSYWVTRDPADDPERMLAEELPGWLGERNLVTTPFAVFGISMGAYGALNYARRTPHPVVAAVSPALFPDWPAARGANAFAGQERWAATDPFQHVDELGDAVVGVWCGTEDRFHPAARRYADLAKPEVARFTRGGHDVGYWLRIVPEVVDFLSARVP